jgi:hypothetical protein
VSRGTATTATTQSPATAGSAPDWFALREAVLVDSIRAKAGQESPSRSTDPALRKSLERHATYVGSGTWRGRRTKLVCGSQYSMLDVALFLEKVYRLCGGDERGAVDAVYDFMDDCLLDGDFTACDAAFLSADPARMRDSVIVSFLIVTQRAKGLLARSRRAFYDRSVAVVSARKDRDYAEKLLGKNQ